MSKLTLFYFSYYDNEVEVYNLFFVFFFNAAIVTMKSESVSCSVMCDSLIHPWTVACQAPLSIEFSRQEYLSG